MITQVSGVMSVPATNLDVRDVVIGVNGHPIHGFTVIDDVLGVSPPGRRTTITDQQGRFSFANSGQRLRFENPAYRPLALPIETGTREIRVQLELANRSDWVLRACKDAHSSKRVGFSVQFTLPNKWESESFKGDASRESVFLFVRGQSAPEANLIVSRILDGTAEGVDARNSKWFEQRWVKTGDGKVVGIDARGRTERHEFWRTATFSDRDIATYQLGAEQSPKTVNEIIDSACPVDRQQQP